MFQQDFGTPERDKNQAIKQRIEQGCVPKVMPKVRYCLCALFVRRTDREIAFNLPNQSVALGGLLTDYEKIVRPPA